MGVPCMKENSISEKYPEKGNKPHYIRAGRKRRLVEIERRISLRNRTYKLGREGPFHGQDRT